MLGPVDTGTLWVDFPVPDCTDPSGDPVVLYDQFVDRWIMTLAFATTGVCYVLTAFALREPAMPGRVALIGFSFIRFIRGFFLIFRAMPRGGFLDRMRCGEIVILSRQLD